jgi:hypothetical protein
VKVAAVGGRPGSGAGVMKKPRQTMRMWAVVHRSLKSP